MTVLGTRFVVAQEPSDIGSKPFRHEFASDYDVYGTTTGAEALLHRPLEDALEERWLTNHHDLLDVLPEVTEHGERWFQPRSNLGNQRRAARDANAPGENVEQQRAPRAHAEVHVEQGVEPSRQKPCFTPAFQPK